MARASSSWLAISLLALLAASRAHAATQTSVPLPGSSRPAQVYASSQALAAGPSGSRPLVLFLRGISCDFTPQQLATLPGDAAGLLAQRTNFAAGGLKLGLPDDVGDMASSAADSLGVIAAAITAPRSMRVCKLCAQSLAAAAAAPAGEAEAQFTLGGAVLLQNASATGTDCPAWDATEACCQAQHSPRGDTDFILAAIDAIAARVPAANRSGVIALGFSNGAFMTQSLACNAPAGRIAGVMAYGGAGDTDASSCKPPGPISVIIAHGMRDLEVPFGGSPATTPAGAARVPATEATLAAWAGRNRCSGSPARSQSSVGALGGSSGGAVTVVSYSGCAAGVLTQGWFVSGWGHLPPRGNNGFFVQAAKRLLGRG